MIRKSQQLWIAQMSKEHRSFKQMMKVATTDASREGYGYKIQKFMRYCKEIGSVSDLEKYEELLKLDAEKITDLLIDYVDWQREKGDKFKTVSSALTAPEAFFEMNRKSFHKKVVRRSNPKDDVPSGGGTPATDEDVFSMIHYAKNLRNKSIIGFLASTGIRPGAIIDPVLRIKHLISLPDITELYKDEFDNPEFKLDPKRIFKRYCYGIKVYDQSKEGYFAFLTPEASDLLDRYFEGRKLDGEQFNDETPIFATYANGSKRWNTKYDFFTDDNLDSMLKSVVKGSCIDRKLVNRKNYDKALTYMFRKRFNGHLKMLNQVNSNIAEKLMAHKRGLDATYLQPTIEQCYVEFFKAIPKLTIEPHERHSIEMRLKDEKYERLKRGRESQRKDRQKIAHLELQIVQINKKIKSK